MVDHNIEINLMRALNEQNMWWRDGSPSEKFAKPFRRRDFYPLLEEYNKKEVMAFVGQRQVGKTTVLYQIIEELIKKYQVNPKRIIYFSFDNPFIGLTHSKERNLINDILDVYSVNVLKESFSSLKEPIYVFFDEICKYPHWSGILKGWYDLKYPIKFYISDSSCSDILKGSSESLAGRIKIQIMLSFKFIDFVKYKFESPVADILNFINWDLRDRLLQFIKGEDTGELFDFIKGIYFTLNPVENQIKTLMNEYLLKDGFPELFDIDSLDESRLKLQNYLSLTIQKDLMRIFEIRNPKALEELISLIASESSQLFVYSNMAELLSITDDTVKEYLGYLESIFLITRSEFYSKSRASRIRKSDKIYLNNIGLRNVLLNKLNEDFFKDSRDLGKVAESLVQDHCRRLKFCFELSSNPELYYWKSKNNHEVDIVVEIHKKPIPIEVKYRNNVSGSELKGIKNFISEGLSSYGFVITKDEIDIRNNLIFIPLWLFLLIC